MQKNRTFDAIKLAQFSDANDEKGKVIEISVTDRQSVAIWAVRPGQRVPAHIHPDGQDTWILLKGELTYFLGNGHKRTISEGSVAVAQSLEIHGAINEGQTDVIFISIYSAPSLKVEWANVE
jgi:quercetin dioxygenase-like cupin family protein